MFKETINTQITHLYRVITVFYLPNWEIINQNIEMIHSVGSIYSAFNNLNIKTCAVPELEFYVWSKCNFHILNDSFANLFFFAILRFCAK